MMQLNPDVETKITRLPITMRNTQYRLASNQLLINTFLETTDLQRSSVMRIDVDFLETLRPYILRRFSATLAMSIHISITTPLPMKGLAESKAFS